MPRTRWERGQFSFETEVLGREMEGCREVLWDEPDSKGSFGCHYEESLEDVPKNEKEKAHYIKQR
jgi:hypothetical protein